MALNKYKLVNERYIHDDMNSGLYFDIAPLKRGAGDEQELNGRVDSENNRLAQIEPAGKVYMPTLMLTVGQYDNLTEHWKNIIAPKSYLMLYVPGGHPSEIDIQFWHAYGNDVFWWASDSVVYSAYDANGLAHRYRVAKEAEVEGTEDPEYPEPYPDVIVAEPVKKWHVTGTKKRWTLFGMKTDIYHLTVEAE
jgi:hypothetical protein